MSEKNYDPRMHTAEHILNQVMVRMFGCSRSKNSHIERKKSKCDYNIDTEPSAEQIALIEGWVNGVIDQHCNIAEDMMDRISASEFLDLSKLPEDAPNTLRVISVGDFDACACIGPHVENTSEIGKFRITSSTYEGGVLRLRFKLG